MMTSRQSQWIVASAFALALIAGAAAGVLATRFSPPAPAATAPGTLEDLQLTVAQREQIKTIWERVRDTSDQAYRKARQLQQDHEKRLVDLLSETQKAEYQKIYARDQDQYARLMGEREAAVKKAVEDTRKLLSDSQRQKYNGVLRSRLGQGEDDFPGHAVWLTGAAQTQPAAPGIR